MLFNVYLIPTRREQYVLISSREDIEALESQSTQRIRQIIKWFTRRRNRIVAWVGRVLSTAYNQYERLEDRIDPGERVLKAMSVADGFVVHFIRAKSRRPRILGWNGGL